MSEQATVPVTTRVRSSHAVAGTATRAISLGRFVAALARSAFTALVLAAFAALVPAAFATPALAADNGGVRLPLTVAGPFTVVAQQVRILRAAPSTSWVLGGQFGADPLFNSGPGSWSIGIQTGAADSHGRTTAVAVFTEQGGSPAVLSPELCRHDRTTDTWSCRIPIPFAPGDTYELLYGGAETPYGPVVHDTTFNFDAFDPITHGTAWYPPLSGLYDSGTYLDRRACAQQGAAFAGVSAPLAGDYGLLGPVGSYAGVGLPESQGAPAPGGEQLSGCARASSLGVIPAASWWSEGERYRALPHVRFALSAHWTRTRTRITGLRPIVSGGRAPMVFELDCFGRRCPFASVRGRYGHLARFEHAVERRPFYVGDRLYLQIGTTSGCGPQCEWGSESLSLRIRSNKLPSETGCEFRLGTSFVRGRRCAE